MPIFENRIKSENHSTLLYIGIFVTLYVLACTIAHYCTLTYLTSFLELYEALTYFVCFFISKQIFRKNLKLHSSIGYGYVVDSLVDDIFQQP